MFRLTMIWRGPLNWRRFFARYCGNRIGFQRVGNTAQGAFRGPEAVNQ